MTLIKKLYKNYVFSAIWLEIFPCEKLLRLNNVFAKRKVGAHSNAHKRQCSPVVSQRLKPTIFNYFVKS